MERLSLAPPQTSRSPTKASATPIRIRGKKQHPKPLGRGKIVKSQSPALTTARNATTSNMLINKALLQRIKTVNSSRSHTKSRPVAHRCSPIETLPLEILQQIFSYCLIPSFDLGLVRASQYIGARLSDHYNYNTYCSLAFRHLRDEAGVTYCLPGAPHVFDRDVVKGRDQALRCRWMTWSYFADFSNALRHAGAEYLEKEVKYLSREQLELKCANRWPRLTILGSHIPTKLLRLPITPDNVSFLKALANAGAEIDSVGSLAAEYANEMFVDAVKRGDEEVQALLLGKTLGFFPSESTLRCIMEITLYDHRLAWRLHQIQAQKDTKTITYRVHTQDCCRKYFPYTDAHVLAGLAKRRAPDDAPKCWRAYCIPRRPD